MHEHIVVICGSSRLATHVVDAIPDAAIVLAVDGGIDHALAAGLEPSGLIGDLDSVSEAGLTWAREHATISRHPTDKDQTDTELALAFAADMSPERITLIGGGDRLDHGIAAIGALGHHSLTLVPHLDGWWDGQHLDVVHGPGRRSLDLEPGSTLSLLSMHGRSTGVHVTGVRWPLDDATLEPLVGWGVSNEARTDLDTNAETDTDAITDTDTVREIVVRVSTGVLTIFDVPRHEPAAPT